MIMTILRFLAQQLVACAWATAFMVAALSACARQTSGSPFLVASDYQGQMRRVDPQSGTILGIIAGGFEAGEIDFGPDGLIYASYSRDSVIRKIDPISGNWVGTIELPGRPRDLTFGPDGQLYIALIGTFAPNGIYKYNLANQQLSARFNTTDLNGTPIGITFGPGNDLFVCLDARFSGNGIHSIVRIDGQTGNSEGVFTSSFVSIPQSLVFEPSGVLDVGNQGTHTITQYSADGTFLGTLSSSGQNPQGLYLLPDGDLVFGRGGGDFARIDSQSRALTIFSSGFSFAHSMVMVPEPRPIALVMALTPLLIVAFGRELQRRRATPE